MKQQYERTSRIIGEEGVDRLHDCSVLVFGTGGVGSYVCEGLARAGIGSLTIVDKDVVDETNINRQIIALHSTIGQPKAKLMADRIRDIDPDCHVTARELFFLPDGQPDDLDFASYDYVVDAVDTVTAKIYIIEIQSPFFTPLTEPGKNIFDQIVAFSMHITETGTDKNIYCFMIHPVSVFCHQFQLQVIEIIPHI